jgi:hypothetical protein
MPHLEFSARRIILAGGFALAFAAAPAVAALVPVTANAAPAASCPAGEEEDLYSGACLPHTVPNSPVNNGLPPSPITEIPGGSLPSVDGIPCTGGNTGQCIGLQENAPKFVQPPTSIDGQ